MTTFINNNNIQNNSQRSKEIMEIKKRADDGDVQAMIEYANILENGDEVPMDLPKASEYYQNASNNENKEGEDGHKRVQGKICQISRDKCSKINEKISSIEKKANDGDVQAMLKYADIIENGKDSNQ